MKVYRISRCNFITDLSGIRLFYIEATGTIKERIFYTASSALLSDTEFTENIIQLIFIGYLSGNFANGMQTGSDVRCY